MQSSKNDELLELSSYVKTRHSFYFANSIHLFHIICEEILSSEPIELIKCNNNVFIFKYYQTQKIYKVTCEIIPPQEVVNILNKSLYDIELNLNDEYVKVPEIYKTDFEDVLKQHLNEYLAPKPHENVNDTKRDDYVTMAEIFQSGDDNYNQGKILK